VANAPRVDEWLAELERFSVPNVDNGPEGFTGDEIADYLEVGHRAAIYRIREWCRHGLVEYAGRRRVVNNVGSISCIPVYRRTNKP
jgi:predicted transcriptional regulator